jgi:hypothetical protein
MNGDGAWLFCTGVSIGFALGWLLTMYGAEQRCATCRRAKWIGYFTATGMAVLWFIHRPTSMKIGQRYVRWFALNFFPEGYAIYQRIEAAKNGRRKKAVPEVRQGNSSGR